MMAEGESETFLKILPFACKIATAYHLRIVSTSREDASSSWVWAVLSVSKEGQKCFLMCVGT